MSSYWNEFCVEKERVKHKSEIISKLEKDNLELNEKYNSLLREYIEYQQLMSNRMYLLFLNNKDNVDLIVNSEDNNV